MMKMFTRLAIAIALILSITDNVDAQVTQTVIGGTTYDLQTNSSVQDRIINHGNGTISAVWTYSNSFDLAAADRGTGYNFFNGTTWLASPTARIEAEKTGWPSIGTTSANSEVFLSHNITNTFITQGVRSTIGAGAWGLSSVTTTNQVWNRMAIGGANGQTIHHISAYDPFGGPYPSTGVQSQLLYWRSQDGGATYDIQEAVIPGLDQTNYDEFGGDSYQIAARGDTVVVVYFGALRPTMMAKSTNNGTSWTTTTLINVFPAGVTYDPNSTSTSGSVIGISDINGDQIADTTTATDGSGWVLIDANGLTHVFFGNMQHIDDISGDGQWSYFPGTNGLMYWNESFGTEPPIAIGGSIDINGNGILDIVGIAQYFQSLSSYPSAGIDANGCIYVSYSAVMENMDQGTQNYRHIYITRSCDGGCTWTTSKDVTPGSGFEENVYASMANLVDSNIHIVFMQDFEPGIAVNGDMDAFVSNNIIYLKVPAADYDTVSTAVCYTNLLGDSIYCSGDSVLLTASCGTAWLWSTGETTQSIYYSGVWGTVTVDITTDCGVIQRSKVLSGPTGPPVISISSTLTEMCPGDSAQLTVSTNAGGSFLWSTTAVTQSISVLTAGTYLVTVTNCGGSSFDSFTITSPSTPVALITASSTTICPGDSATLFVNTVPQGSYLWSTGDTTTSVVVDSIGTYSVTVTNCSGTDSVAIVISLPPPPTAAITGSTPFCDGDSITITAVTVPGASYLWSTGDTTQAVVIDSAKAYTVYVTSCGGTDSATVTTAFYGAMTASVLATGPTTFCDDGGVTNVSLTVFVFGGLGPFSYAWSSGPTLQTITLSAASQSGGHYVTITDACGSTINSDTTQVVIGEVLASVTSTNAACGGTNGTATGIGTLGTSPYFYQWDDPSSQTAQTATGLMAGTVTVIITDVNGCSDTTSTTLTSTPAPTATAIGTNPSSCGVSDGSAFAVTTGGTPGYTYIWSTGGTTASVSNLGAGIYFVTVSDVNGCSDTSFVTIASSSAPSLVTNTTTSTCAVDNGTATVTVTGGTIPYSYLWNDPNSQTNATATGLAAGTYTIIVIDGASCLNSTTAVVGSPASPALVLTGTDPLSCGSTDGSVTSTTTLGTTPYTYLWSNAAATANISLLSAGVYSLTVTDVNGCTDSATANLNSPGAPTLSIAATSETCLGNDGTTTVIATGGTLPYLYSWDDPSSQTNATATGLTPGSYTVSVTDSNSCLISATIAVGSLPSPTITAIGTNPSSCGASDGSAIATTSSGIPPYSYLWSSGSTSTSVTGLSAGIYFVTVTDGNACQDSSFITIASSSAPSLSTTSTSTSCAVNDGTATVTVTGGIAPYTYLWNDPSSQTTVIATGLGAGTYTIIVIDSASCLNTATATVGIPSSPTINATGTNPSTCGVSDGAVSTTTSGGTSPFTYLWSNAASTPNISTLSAGVYSITITDVNGCTDADTVSLNSPGAPTITVSSTDASCLGNDGSTSVTGIGGTLPYTYSWSDPSSQSNQTATGLSSGTYFITLTDSVGCVATASATVGGSASTMILGFVKLDVSCNGDSDGIANVSALGGTAPYLYSWSTGSSSTGITGLGVGTYTVTVTDSTGCTAMDSVTIDQPSALTSSISKTDASCDGNSDGSIDFSVSGGTSPYAFSWSNSDTTEDVSGLAAGNFSVTATDANGCTITGATAIVNLSSGPITSSIIGPIAVSEFDIDNYSVGFTAGSIYNWTIVGGNQSSGGQTNSISVQWASAGTGQVYVIETDASGCVGDTIFLAVIISQGVGIGELESDLTMTIFPNPSNGKFTMNFDLPTDGTEVVEVVNIIGQRIYFEQLSSGTQSHEVELGEQTAGIYFLSLSSDRIRITKKIVLH